VVEERCTKWFTAIEATATGNAPENRNIGFKPLVFSTGGLMSPGTLRELEMWTRELEKVAVGRLLDRIRICLLEARTKLLAGSLVLGDGTVSEEIV